MDETTCSISGSSTGQIAAIDRNLPEQPGDRSLDLAGFVVTPGIIDMHAHVAISHIRSELSLHPFVNTIESGVTTVVDAGTTGWRDFSDFRHDVIENPRVTAKIRVLSYVNIVGSGMGGGGFGGAWEHEAAEMNPRLAGNTAIAHSDVVVGIKTAHYWARRRFDEAHPCLARRRPGAGGRQSLRHAAHGRLLSPTCRPRLIPTSF
jgi:dihydroorotase